MLLLLLILILNSSLQAVKPKILFPDCDCASSSFNKENANISESIEDSLWTSDSDSGDEICSSARKSQKKESQQRTKRSLLASDSEPRDEARKSLKKESPQGITGSFWASDSNSGDEACSLAIESLSLQKSPDQDDKKITQIGSLLKNLTPRGEQEITALLEQIESPNRRKTIAKKIFEQISPMHDTTPHRITKALAENTSLHTPKLLAAISKSIGTPPILNINFDHLNGRDPSSGFHFTSDPERDKISVQFTGSNGVYWGSFKTANGRFKVSTFYPYRDEHDVVHSIDQAWNRNIATSSSDRIKKLGVDNYGIPTEFIISKETGEILTLYPILHFMEIDNNGRIKDYSSLFPDHSTDKIITITRTCNNPENIRYMDAQTKIIDISQGLSNELVTKPGTEYKGIYVKIPNTLL